MATVARLLADAHSEQSSSARLARERTHDQFASSSSRTPDEGNLQTVVEKALPPVSVNVGSYGDVVLERRSDPAGLGSTCLRPLRGLPSDYVALAACEVLDRRLCSHCSALEDRSTGATVASTSSVFGGGSGGGFDLRRAVLHNRLQSLMPAAGKEELASAAEASLAAADAAGRSLTGLSLLNLRQQSSSSQ